MRLQLRLCNSHSWPATHTHTHIHRAEQVCQPLRATYSSCTVHTRTHTHCDESLSQAFASRKHHAGTQPEANKAGEVSEHVGQAGEEYGRGEYAYVIHIPPSCYMLLCCTSRSGITLSLFVHMGHLLIRWQVCWAGGQSADADLTSAKASQQRTKLSVMHSGLCSLSWLMIFY